MTTDVVNVQSAKSPPWATVAIIAAQSLLFVAAWLASGRTGGWIPSLEVETLIRWGGNSAPWTQDGEWWRLVTSKLLFPNVLSLAMDCWVLWCAGPMLERRLGSFGLLSVFFGSAMVAGLASLAFNPPNYLIGGGAAPLLAVFGALVGSALAMRELPTWSELRPLRYSGTLFALMLIFIAVFVGLDIAGIFVGFLTGVLLGITLTPDNHANRGVATHWPLAGAVVLISTGLLWTQLKPPPFLKADAETVLARLEPIASRQKELKLELDAWREQARDAQPPFSAAQEQLDRRLLPEWIRLQEQMRAQPRAPGTAGEHYVPQGRENIDRTVRTLQAAAESLRTGDEQGKKKARDLVSDAFRGIGDVRTLAVLRRPNQTTKSEK